MTLRYWPIIVCGGKWRGLSARRDGGTAGRRIAYTVRNPIIIDLCIGTANKGAHIVQIWKREAGRSASPEAATALTSRLTLHDALCSHERNHVSRLLHTHIIQSVNGRFLPRQFCFEIGINVLRREHGFVPAEVGGEVEVLSREAGDSEEELFERVVEAGDVGSAGVDW